MTIKDRVAVLEEIDALIDCVKSELDYLEKMEFLGDISRTVAAKSIVIRELEKLAKGI